MPRELVHWDVLDQSLRVLEQGGVKGCTRLITENLEAAYLGAIAVDAPYYYRLGNDSFAEVAEAIHGRDGGDTLAAVRRMLAYANDSDEKDLLFAFILGWITHIATDIVFHPMIFFFTGDYYHPDSTQCKIAQTRHRLFEVYLDSWIRSRRNTNRNTISEVLSGLGSRKELIYQMLGKCCKAENPQRCSQRLWRRSIWYLSVTQGLFVSTWAGVVMRMIDQITFGYFRSVDALFTFARADALAWFDDEHEFKNPVTGENYQQTIEQLTELAVRDSVSMLLEVEGFLTGGETEIPFSKSAGKSLNYGIVGAKSSDASYYSSSGIDIKGLSK